MAESSFVRWQQVTLKQLGYTVHLLVGLTTASLGFGVTLLRDAKAVGGGGVKWVVGCSLALLLLSLVLGIFCIVNRLRDFRLTARIARERTSGNRDEERLGTLRLSSEQLGELTWTIFWLQLAFFALGAVVLVSSVTVHFLSALYVAGQ